MQNSSTHGILERLRGDYLRSLAQKAAEFNAACAGRDFAVMSRLGHQMKGSGRSYGFPDVSELGERVEDAAAHRRLVLLEAMALELCDLVRRLEHLHASSEQA